MIGLMGAHRTGKTTLAKKFAEKYDLPFITSRASVVFSELGLNVADDYPFHVRLQVQQIVLQRMSDQYSAAGRTFVTDRTPLDALAYTLADVQKNNITAEEGKTLKQYSTDCFDLMNRSFYSTMLIPPALPYVVDPGKPPPNTMYQEHIHSLIFGLVMDLRAMVSCTVLPREETDIDIRMMRLSASFDNAIMSMDGLRERYVFH